MSDPCPWAVRVSISDSVDYSAFDAGHLGANTWFAKAQQEHTNGRMSTSLLVNDATVCGYYSNKTISLDKGETAALIAWLALDVTHHGSRLGKRLVLEAVAHCVGAAGRSPFRYIVLDLASDAPAHTQELYEGVGFVQSSSDPRRFRMKVSKAKAIIEGVVASGAMLVSVDQAA